MLRNLFVGMFFIPDTGANGGEGDQGNADGEGQAAPEGATGGEKTFTQADLDRIVAERVAREKKGIEAQIENARKEAERLAKMSAEEKAKAEQELLEANLRKREEEITKRELRATGLEELTKRNLPTELIGLLKLDNEEAYKESLASVEKGFLAAVQKGVEGRLAGSTPKDKDVPADNMDQYRKAMGLN